jgi:hypothetical protein
MADTRTAISPTAGGCPPGYFYSRGQCIPDRSFYLASYPAFSGNTRDFFSVVKYVNEKYGRPAPVLGGDSGLTRESVREAGTLAGSGFGDWLNTTFRGNEPSGWLTGAVGAVFGLAAGAGLTSSIKAGGAVGSQTTAQSNAIREQIAAGATDEAIFQSNLRKIMDASNTLPTGTGYAPGNSVMPADSTQPAADPKKLTPDFSPLMLLVIVAVGLFFLIRR